MTDKILVADDEEDMLSLVKRILSAEKDYEVLGAKTGVQALDMLMLEDADVVLTDLKMPDMDGLELLEKIKERWPDKAVIMMTAYGSIETAVEAMKRGAYDYITKPFQYDNLLSVVDRALERMRLIRDRQQLQIELQNYYGFNELIGTSKEMTKIYDTIRSVAGISVPVLITGESGTGKELVAKAIHYASKRKDKRFVAVNCSALPEAILESELFGHARGAFTGALRDKRGLIEEADGGTLLIDEAGDISPSVQVKLLRVLQDGEFRPLGTLKDKRADLRIISATNKKLEDDVAKGSFREDLYYRLKVITIEMPPLRQRKEDIPLLAVHFMKKFAQKFEKEVSDIAGPALWRLANHPWKGNVRELENTVARAVAISKDMILEEEDLFPPEEANLSTLSFREARKRALSDFYRSYIIQELIKNKGNVSRTARTCGIMRQSLQQIMKRAGIDPEDYK